MGDRQIVVARELTKIHEGIIYGTLREVAARLSDPIGEFTVLVDIGQMGDIAEAERPGDLDLWREFCRMTDSAGGRSRRAAVALLARQYRLAPNLVYAALERGKKMAE